MKTLYQNPIHEYRRSSDQSSPAGAHHPVIVIGAGPVGLVAGIDAALQGIPTLILDDNNTMSVGSRAVCHTRRTLEVLDRLGCGESIVARGVTWTLGKVFFRDRLMYSFKLVPELDNHRPTFVNLQQYHLERCLVDRATNVTGLEIRWKNRVTAVRPQQNRVDLKVETPDGPYRLSCDYLFVADGANSSTRVLLGLESRGQRFRDRFLIADVVMHAEEDHPTERWFWFDPPFHKGYSALLHRQADNVWRIDFQLGWDADPELETQTQRVVPRLQAMLGEQRPFELAWVGVYTFRCRRMQRFRHGRVLFAGDAAHQVSPFGARGANSGMQDADNLIWKLKLVWEGKAPDTLLDSYDEERIPVADDNILNSTRSSDFIAPKSRTSRAFRDAALMLAEHYPFARRLVNSGRLSTPAHYLDSSLNTPDEDLFTEGMRPGSPSTDAPVITEQGADWWLQCIGGAFHGLYFADPEVGVRQQDREVLDAMTRLQVPIWSRVVTGGGPDCPGLPSAAKGLGDPKGLLCKRFDAQPGTFYLLRPDQYVAARWRKLRLKKIEAALQRATGRAQ